MVGRRGRVGAGGEREGRESPGRAEPGPCATQTESRASRSVGRHVVPTHNGRPPAPDATRARPYGLRCGLYTYIHSCRYRQAAGSIGLAAQAAPDWLHLYRARAWAESLGQPRARIDVSRSRRRGEPWAVSIFSAQVRSRSYLHIFIF